MPGMHFGLLATEDRYGGVTANLGELSEAISDTGFGAILAESLQKWKEEEKTAVWLQVPIHCSRFIEMAALHGFQFHSAEDKYCLLKLWLQKGKPDTTPRFATHQLGVCGVVLREDTKQLLVIQERRSQFTLWKFPGGLADLGENIGDAAVRETFEETGIKTDFASVIAMRQQHTHPGAFGRSDLYVICRLRPLTFDISPCDHEIAQCTWMSVEELRQKLQISSLTHRLTSLISYGLEHGFDQIDLKMEQLESLYKGLTFQLFHRPLQKTKK